MSPAFWRSLRLLGSPPSIGAMLLLLVNDHWLRHVAPSWWTGKLGDLAWLFFFPFALAVLLAMIPPLRGWRHEIIVPAAAFGTVGTVFVLGKTVPAFRDGLVALVAPLLGYPITITLDPTDLIALVSLVLGWRHWDRHKNAAPLSAGWGGAALAAAMTLTLANQPAIAGVSDFCVRDSNVIVRGTLDYYVARRGGLEWQALPRRFDAAAQKDFVAHDEAGTKWETFGEFSSACARIVNQGILKVDARTAYRFGSGKTIEQSDDGGATWRVVYAVTPISQMSQAAQRTHRWSANTFPPAPLNAIVEPKSGNLLFAMGTEGVLALTPNNEWVWASVGNWRHVEFNQVEEILSVLTNELWLAIGLGLLILLTLLHRMHARTWRKILLVIYWILWGLNALLFPVIAAMLGSYVYINLLVMIPGCLYLLVWVAIDTFTLMRRNVWLMLRVAALALAGAAVYFASYVLWTRNVVPDYNLATGMALALSLLTLFIAWLSTREVAGVF